MPWDVVKDTDACPVDKPWAVKNKETGSVRGRCHGAKEEAVSQQKALYASLEGRKQMSDTLIPFLTPVKNFSEGEWIDGNKKWIQFYPYDTWTHPIFSDTTIDKETATKLKEHFDAGVRGQKIFADYEHGQDPNKGKKASGEVIQVEVRDDGLYGLVQFTDVAKQEIDRGEWNYWSTSHYDTWTHPQTSETYEFVLDGGALTNKPHVKGMLPLNFSEVLIENPDFVAPVITHDDDEVVVEETDDNDDGGETVDESKLRELLGLDEKGDIEVTVQSLVDEVGPLRELAKQHTERKKFSEEYPDQFAQMEQDRQFRLDAQAKQFSEHICNLRFKIDNGDRDDDDKPVIESTTQGLSGLAITKLEDAYKLFASGEGNLKTFSESVEAIFDNGIVDYGETGSTVRPEDETPEDRKIATAIDARKEFGELVDKRQAEILKENTEMTPNAALSQAVKDSAEKHPKLYESYRTARG